MKPELLLFHQRSPRNQHGNLNETASRTNSQCSHSNQVKKRRMQTRQAHVPWLVVYPSPFGSDETWPRRSPPLSFQTRSAHMLSYSCHEQPSRPAQFQSGESADAVVLTKENGTNQFLLIRPQREYRSLLHVVMH